MKLRGWLGPLLVALAAVGYQRLRPWMLSWDATDAEVASRLPGDDLLPGADGISTRAISIAAPAADVWPWLAQMGPAPRGGAYTYDWIENLLGLDMRNRHGTATGCGRSRCASTTATRD